MPDDKSDKSAKSDQTGTGTSVKEAVTGTGKEEASRVKGEVTSQTSRLLGEAGTQTRERADTQVRGMAGQLGRFSEDLGEMAAHSPHPDSYVTALARDSASMTREMSERLRSGGLDSLTDEVTGFARRRPGLFLASAFAVGLGLGRLSKNADLRRLASSTSGNGGPSQDGPSHDGPSQEEPSESARPAAEAPTRVGARSAGRRETDPGMGG